MFRSGAVHQGFLGSPVSRRALLQSIPVIPLALAPAEIALAASDSADASSQKTRQLRIDQRFVLFPIHNESLSRRVRLVKSGRVLRSFTASRGLPAHWWAHLDVSDWQGETLTLSIEPDNTALSTGMAIAGTGASETDNAELIPAIRT